MDETFDESLEENPTFLQFLDAYHRFSEADEVLYRIKEGRILAALYEDGGKILKSMKDKNIRALHSTHMEMQDCLIKILSVDMPFDAKTEYVGRMQYYLENIVNKKM
jgi:hypothetical protein